MIERRRGVLGGGPCVAGTRIPTRAVAYGEQVLYGGARSHYPQLTDEQIAAAVAYEARWWRRLEFRFWAWRVAVQAGWEAGWDAYQEERRN